MKFFKSQFTETSIYNYYKENFIDIAPHWDILPKEVLNPNKEKERIKILKQHIPLQKNWKILELGSGFGNFCLFMKKSGYYINRIEPDAFCFSVIKNRFKENGLENPVVKSFAEKLPYQDSSFDLVCSFQLLEHVENIDKVINESKRVLKNKGHLYIVAPNYKSIWEAIMQ